MEGIIASLTLPMDVLNLLTEWDRDKKILSLRKLRTEHVERIMSLL